MTHRIAAGVLLIAALASAATVPRFTDPQRRAKLEAILPQLESVFERYREEQRIPGLVYGVVIDGDPVFIKGLGVRDRNSKDPVTADTVFRIASMTKSFTTVALLRLRDEGRLSLDDPVSTWIPEFGKILYPTTDTPPIRIRDLLSHSAGFPEDNPWGDRQLAVSDEMLARWIEEGIPFSTPPATEYEYSNFGFALLGRIVSNASGSPYREYLERHVLVPLGMGATTLDPGSVPAALRATGYRIEGDGFAEEKPLGHGAFGSMGGLLTSGNDLARYVAFQLSAYPPRDGEEGGPVRRSSLREMQSLHREGLLRVEDRAPLGPVQVTTGGYGFGLRITRDCRFDHIVGHGGGLPGFGSYMQWLPDYGVGIFAMANLTYAGPAAPIDRAWDILRSTGALQPRKWTASPALIKARDQFAGLWKNWNETAAKEFAAGNLFLDRSEDSRRAEIERLKQSLGNCTASADIESQNLLRGTFQLACDKGAVLVRMTLAPTMPPKVQYLSLTPIHRLDGAMKNAADGLADMFSQKRSSVKLPAAVVQDVRSLRPVYGACRVGDTRMNDAANEARLRLSCERGMVDATVMVEGGIVKSVRFQAASDGPCPGY